MAAQKDITFMVEGAQLIYRNFEGRQGRYNAEGVRSVSVIVDNDMAEQLAADGWNVKTQKLRPDAEEGVEPYLYVPIGINFDIKPPSIWLLTSKGRTRLVEETVDILDWADFANVDLVCRGYRWTQPSGDSGIKAYLKTMFATVEEDELERKYAIAPKGDDNAG